MIEYALHYRKLDLLKGKCLCVCVCKFLCVFLVCFETFEFAHLFDLPFT